MGRRAHRPDAFHRRQVEAMAGYGVPERDIARVLAVDAKTLRRHYREELDTGHIKATAKVAEFLFRKATTEGPQCVTAAIFWMKTRGGWRETPQQHQVAVANADFSQLSDQELENIILFYRKEIGTAGTLLPPARGVTGGPEDKPPQFGFPTGAAHHEAASLPSTRPTVSPSILMPTGALSKP